MEIAPNVHWLQLSFSNAYLCLGEDGLTLIDAGMPGQSDAILNAISRLGYRPADLKRILITHADIDHAGSAAALVRETGAILQASAATASFLRRGQGPRHLPSLVQALADRIARYEPVGDVAVFAPNTPLPVLGGLVPLPAPGHTPEQHVLYSQVAGILFAADALNTRGGKLQMMPGLLTADRAAARATALRLLDLAPAIFACGHGPPLHDHNSDDLLKLHRQLQRAAEG